MSQSKKKECKVSIILPNYNSSETIRETISSILNQTYKNWELIIVDDNSDKTTKSILSEYKKLDVVPILTKQGYRYYIDLRPGDLPQLSYSLLAMFYLGSAARYRPLEVKSLLEGELRPLVSEFVSLSPKQFLYQMVSLTTSKECVIPFSAI